MGLRVRAVNAGALTVNRQPGQGSGGAQVSSLMYSSGIASMILLHESRIRRLV